VNDSPANLPSSEVGADIRTSGRSFLYKALPVAFLPALCFTLLNVWWAARCPSSAVYSGYLQGDQPTYTALARAVFNRGNGILYANPFDFDAAAPRLLTNLGYVALGWLIRLVGQHDVVAWEIWRLAFGLLCYGLFALLVARLFLSNGMRWWVFVVGAFGGGSAWVATLALAASRPHWGWLRCFVEAERGYDWWCLNLFRQSLYPLELAYHSLYFAVLLCYLDRRRGWLLLVIFLLWWTHTVTAILATTVVGLALLWDWLASAAGGKVVTPPERPKRAALTLIGLAGVVLPWIAYYRLYLPRFPSIQSWMEQTLSFEFVLQPSVWPRAWGMLLVGLPAALVYAPLRRYLAREREGRLILLWGIAAMVWAHNNVFLTRPIQPMHFARGYIFLFLLIVAAKGVEIAIARNQASKGQGGDGSPKRRRGVGKWAAVALVPLLLADNVLFVARVGSEMPQPGLLTISPEAKEVLDYFCAQPGRLGILSTDQKIGVLIVARTRHRLFLSEAVLTPFFTERALDAANILRAGSADLARRYGVERLILMKVQGFADPAWRRNPAEFETLLDNRLYTVGRVVRGKGAGDQPTPNMDSPTTDAIQRKRSERQEGA